MYFKLFKLHSRVKRSVAQPQTIYGVVSLSAPMGQNSQNIQCHCEPVTDVTGVAIPRIGVKPKIS